MLKVFVGTDSSVHGDAEKVLEYSIRKNTAEDVELVFMDPGWKSVPTGFTTHRYMIPQLCNWEGYAIYLDVDMLVLGDLSELMSYKQEGKWAICAAGLKTTTCDITRYRDEVAVIDCSLAVLPTEEQLKTKEGQLLARQALRDYYAPIIPPTWNTDTLSPEAKLIHYTNLRTQPWQPNPMVDYMPYHCEKTCDLFFDYLDATEMINTA
jgi:hypothetical protein